MDYEKKYNETLKRAKDMLSYKEVRREDMEYLFPELKDTEDEKIKKGLRAICSRALPAIFETYGFTKNDAITWLEKQKPVTFNSDDDERIRKEIIDFIYDKTDTYELREKSNSWLAWLEKQGEQPQGKTALEAAKEEKINNQNCSSADNVEPKFKVDDFIVNDYCMGKVIELTNDAYLLDTGQGIPFSCEHNAHLWTIKDAKEGDVLASDYYVVVFKRLWKCKTAFDWSCGIELADNVWYFDNKGEDDFDPTDFHPATKEQRDKLEKVMFDAGYEWDSEKKELKMIEQKPAEWSEEQKARIDRIVEVLDWAEDKGRISHDTWRDYVTYVTSLKPQPQPKDWSEEDERMRSRLEWIFTEISTGSDSFYGNKVQPIITWLKSLRPQNHWKPSEEQLKALDDALSLAKNCGEECAFYLGTLYDDLKKL